MNNFEKKKKKLSQHHIILNAIPPCNNASIQFLLTFQLQKSPKDEPDIKEGFIVTYSHWFGGMMESVSKRPSLIKGGAS
jgi:hypothetical protein